MRNKIFNINNLSHLAVGAAMLIIPGALIAVIAYKLIKKRVKL